MRTYTVRSLLCDIARFVKYFLIKKQFFNINIDIDIKKSINYLLIILIFAIILKVIS